MALKLGQKYRVGFCNVCNFTHVKTSREIMQLDIFMSFLLSETCPTEKQPMNHTKVKQFVITDNEAHRPIMQITTLRHVTH
jgi:hypothetical protein